MAASLLPGVLQKLLQEMSSAHECDGSPRSDPDDDKDAPPPAILQVTSIVPAIGGADGGLFPDRGFLLKVSDSSHAIYASLPQEQGDLILADELSLGQLIHVRRLDPASPVPVLRGVRPLPGRYPLGNPSDLVPAGAAGDPPTSIPMGFLPLGGASTSAGPPPPDGGRKPRSVSASRGDTGKSHGWRSGRKESKASRSIPTSPVRSAKRRSSVDAASSDMLKELAKISVACVREDSDDSDSSRSSISSVASRKKTLRRSWDAPTKRGRVPIPRSTQIGPTSQNKFAHLPRDYSSDHQLHGRRVAGQATRGLRTSGQQKPCVSSKVCKESSCPSSSLGSTDDVKRAEGNVLPTSLPSSLLKMGKEVVRHRDLALLTAVDALQEAYVSDRLLHSLSSYPEIQSSKEDDSDFLVDRFLSFLDDLRHGRLVAQSLAKVTPRTANSEPVSSFPTKDAVKIATEDRKHAASWIKAAMESNSPPEISQAASSVDTTSDEIAEQKSSSSALCSKSIPFLSRRRLNYDMWLKGSGPLAAADLANTLQGECNKWFLSYIEKFLDRILSETVDTSSENQIASLLFQIKKVDEWLDGIASREISWRDSHKESLPETEETEACQRVRKKIYGILLKHVDRAANALEIMSATDEGSASEGWE